MNAFYFGDNLEILLQGEYMRIFLIGLAVQALICGIFASYLAEEKRYSAGSWFACGFFFGIFGLIAAAGLPLNRYQDEPLYYQKRCPECSEMIKLSAFVCKYCGQKFSNK
jgi:hypothetical protein